MFAALVRDRGALAPELTDVRRFLNPWEKAASVSAGSGGVGEGDQCEHEHSGSADRSGVGGRSRNVSGR
jgi:hypothetical protein